jgi:uncharacterized protein (TIGR03067 family)
MRTSIACLLAGLTFWIGVISLAADDTGREALAGAWQATAGEKSGKPAPELKGHELVFSGDRFTIRSKAGKLLFEGTVRVDTSKSPPSIDFVHTKGDAQGKTWLGIYELAGDALKICDNAGDVTKPRPTALATQVGSGLDLLTFRRLKK